MNFPFFELDLFLSKKSIMEITDTDTLKLKKAIKFYYNHLKISSNKTNVPVFIVQTKVVWYALKLVYILNLNIFEEWYGIIHLEQNWKENKKEDLKKRFDKYFDQFEEKNIIKKKFDDIYFEEIYKRKEFQSKLDGNEIEKLSWIRACRGFYYHDAIYLENKKVFHLTLSNDTKFNSNKKCKFIIDSIDNFLKESVLFKIRKCIYRFSSTKNYLTKIKINNMCQKKIKNKHYNFLFDNCQHFTSKLLGHKQISPDIQKIKNLFNKGTIFFKKVPNLESESEKDGTSLKLFARYHHI